MKKLLTLAAFSLWASNIQAQLKIRVLEKSNLYPIIGAIIHIAGTNKGTVTDTNGMATLNSENIIPLILNIHAIGYKDLIDTLAADKVEKVIYLEPDREDMDELVVSSTRSGRLITNIPTRVELIAGEELDEKGNMKPGDIRMVLNESTGIQVLQTSPVSGNASIRIQGLDGRYTQLLKDGMPLYNGLSGGLGLLQTPPLDLKRVEIIKGATSTLYGGGAIAGLVNLISKGPEEKGELNFLINGTTSGGMDVSNFYGKKFGKIGITVYTAWNGSKAYAPGNTEFAAIPQFGRYNISPRIYLYADQNNELMTGLNLMYENRIGGDIRYLRGTDDSSNAFFEKNISKRASTQFQWKHKMKGGEWNIKNSISFFRRNTDASTYTFHGLQLSSFTEANIGFKLFNSEWIAGVNVYTDNFKEDDIANKGMHNYVLSTYGLFVQNTTDISRKVTLETGLRTDYITQYTAVALPKVSLLYKINDKWTSRLGGGLGYKTPTIFIEATEQIPKSSLLPISQKDTKIERSYGVNADINYKTLALDNKLSIAINELIFYTRLDDPLQLEELNNVYQLKNTQNHFDAMGSETNVKLTYGDFHLFLGYTYTHTLLHTYPSPVPASLTAPHKTNTVLMYELEEKWKLGLEAYYYSPTTLKDGSKGHDYWLCGLMAERRMGHWAIFVNFENILNVRQTRFEPIFTGSVTQPNFKEIYAPLDGFIANGGLKINL